MILAPTATANPAYDRASRREGARRVLDVWGAWRWARANGADCPTMAAVWDRLETDSQMWVNAQTGDTKIAVECPGRHWQVAQAWVSPRSHEVRFGLQPGERWRLVEEVAAVKTGTRRMESPVQLVGLAVEELLVRDGWATAWVETLLMGYPRSGIYERPAPSWERYGRRGQGGKIERAVSASFSAMERHAIGLVMSGRLAVRRVA